MKRWYIQTTQWSRDGQINPAPLRLVGCFQTSFRRSFWCKILCKLLFCRSNTQCTNRYLLFDTFQSVLSFIKTKKL